MGNKASQSAHPVVNNGTPVTLWVWQQDSRVVVLLKRSGVTITNKRYLDLYQEMLVASRANQARMYNLIADQVDGKMLRFESEHLVNNVSTFLEFHDMYAEEFYVTDVVDGRTTGKLELLEITGFPIDSKKNRKLIASYEVVPAKKATCIITFDEVLLKDGVSCAENHFLSRDAFDQHVRTEVCKDFDTLYKDKGYVCCPLRHHGCDAAPFTVKVVAEYCQRSTFELFMRGIKKCAYQDGFLQVDPELVTNEALERQLRSMFKKVDGTYSAYACPKCEYGPIEHIHCANLQTHHQENKGGQGHINNGCPRCGHFVSDISQWKAWDGMIIDSVMSNTLQNNPETENETTESVDENVTDEESHEVPCIVRFINAVEYINDIDSMKLVQTVLENICMDSDGTNISDSDGNEYIVKDEIYLDWSDQEDAFNTIQAHEKQTMFEPSFQNAQETSSLTLIQNANPKLVRFAQEEIQIPLVFSDSQLQQNVTLLPSESENTQGSSITMSL